jgi:competence protein ComEA
VRLFSQDQQAIALLLGVIIFFMVPPSFPRPSCSTPSPPSSHLPEPDLQWIVEAAGAVRDPGTYIFDEPPTAYRVIQKAGGANCGQPFSPEAVGNALDTGVRLEVRASNGACARIIITPMDATKRLILGIPVAINEARFEDLAMIPGISEGLSQRIIKFRETHGPFKTWNGLERVKGIGPKRVEKLRSYLTLK